MRFNKYIKWQIKQWLPLFIITFVILATDYLLFALTSSGYNYYAVINGYTQSYWNNEGTGLLTLLILTLICAIIFAIFAYDYRLKKKEVDTFMQAPFFKNNLRITRILIGLAMILIAFTLVYFIGIIIFYIKQYNLEEVLTTGSGATYYLTRFNGWYVILSYFYLIIVITIFYLFNCLVVSFADTINDTALLLTCSYLVIFFFEALIFYSLYGFTNYNNDTLRELALYSLASSPLCFPVMIFYIVFNNLIMGIDISIDKSLIGDPSTAIVYINIILLVAIIAFAIYVLFFKKDPSGEHAGVGGPRNFKISLIVHVFIFMFGLLYNFSTLFYSTHIKVIFFFGFLIFFAVLGYCLLALYNRSFKIGKYNLYAYLTNIGIIFILGLTFSLISEF